MAAPKKSIIKAIKPFFIYLPLYQFPVIGIQKTGTPEPAAPTPDFLHENITFFILFQEKCFAAVDDLEKFFKMISFFQACFYW
ncbi:MAG: hypothetical protein A3J85_03315 [Desulfobacula sp. RIFOXYA12_FULL_46_16]|nr:MAG: hypothetical protein A3J85_03315 [Desulfobacula sp. RIFOXYA12_FULL_46_16]